MLTREEATLLVAQYIERHIETPDLPLALLPDATAEYPFGWVFFYTSRDFIRTGDPVHAVAGNSPLLVERQTGRIFVTGTALPTQAYVDRYLETGDPHGEISRCVVLDPMPSPSDKVLTIQAIREVAGLGLVDAKSAVDRCLKGERVFIMAPDADAAGELIARLEALGWNPKRYYNRAGDPSPEAG